MDLAHLKLFRDIASRRSITQGARANRVSQSAASQHIQELERLFGVPLIDRSRRPIELTPAGRLYFEFCRDVLRRKEEFDTAIERLRSRIEGIVRVASIYSVGLAEVSKWAREFQHRYPEVQLDVEYLRPERVYEAVLSDAADLGIVSYPEASRELEVLPWRKEVMLVVTRPEDPLAFNTFLDPRELHGREFIAFDDDLPIAREIRRYLRSHGVEPRTVMHFDNVVMIKEAVALGSGVSLLPEPVIQEDLAQEKLVGIPLKSPGLYRPLGIIHRRKKQLSRATRAFLDLLIEQVRSLAAPAAPPPGGLAGRNT